MFKPGRGIRLRSSGRSDTGQMRDNNEDSIHLWSHGDHMVLAVVADGMGGAVAGEEASRIAVETIKTGLTSNGLMHPDGYYIMDEDTLIKQLKTTVRNANNNIIDQAQKRPEFKGMGTTMTLAFIRNTHAIIGHVGDSRAYLVDGGDGHIMQVTSDHSFVQALVNAGHITEDEAEEHPMRNVLYRALGQSRDVEVDVYYEQLHVGDRLVLCSDGLTLHVKPSEIAQIALAQDEPDTIAEALIALANQRGGRDNVSVLVIKVEQNETSLTDDADELDSDFDTTPFTVGDLGFGFDSSESSNFPKQELKKSLYRGQ
ncbi:MAG: Stp1/IreP family PP2C-type Ser/Thr phosphatase [bacterium]|nr:Stp1/IreP family PP2C-type Ser/Thr phosphatase [bacterium]